jgi:hypothetical protein
MKKGCKWAYQSKNHQSAVRLDLESRRDSYSTWHLRRSSTIWDIWKN